MGIIALSDLESLLSSIRMNCPSIFSVGWDSKTNMMILFMSNPGHTPGIDAKYFIDDLKRYVKAHRGKGTMADQLSAYLIDSSNQIDRGQIDFFQVNVFH